MMHNAVASAMWGNGTSENHCLVVVPMFHITGMVSHHARGGVRRLPPWW
jgi:fatty-acyl-CoA synthase